VPMPSHRETSKCVRGPPRKTQTISLSSPKPQETSPFPSKSHASISKRETILLSSPEATLLKPLQLLLLKSNSLLWVKLQCRENLQLSGNGMFLFRWSDHSDVCRSRANDALCHGKVHTLCSDCEAGVLTEFYR